MLILISWTSGLNIHWSEFVTNDEIRSRTGQPLLSDTVRSRRLSFFGHLLRRRPMAGSSPSSSGLHYGLCWWLEMEGRSPQTILAQNRGCWPAANESRTSDGETTRPGQIGMAATCGNGYVFDKLLTERETTHLGRHAVVILPLRRWVKLTSNWQRVGKLQPWH